MTIFTDQEATDKICVALDNMTSLIQIRSYARDLYNEVGFFKIGNETFTEFGIDAIEAVHSQGGRVFLDLKYHDIPHTVKGAARAATKHGVYMFNVHAAGGSVMMQAALEGAKEGVEKYGTQMPKILGVTLLTSIDEETLNKELRVHGTPAAYVSHLARLTEQSGLDGIICAAPDLYEVRKEVRPEFICGTPGIKSRTSGKVGNDQARISTAGAAVQAGASFIVVGRAITDYSSAEERKKAAFDIRMEILYS